MLNYIWLLLVVIGILTAIGKDVNDEIQNTYRNGKQLTVEISFTQPPMDTQQRMQGTLYLTGKSFSDFYGIASINGEVKQPVVILKTSNYEMNLTFAVGDETPHLWKEMSKSSMNKDKLSAKILKFQLEKNSIKATALIQLEPIQFVKLKAVTQAAIDFAAIAVQISIGLIGIMALWLGIMRIAENAGAILVFTKIVKPVTKRLFPEIPSDHPAIGAMLMNIAANVLGLSNAATPLGLKAMEELNKLNPKLGTATNAMCTFLVINTGGFILVPATVIAIRASLGSANPGLVIATSMFGSGCATITGLIAVKLMQRMKIFNKDVAEDSRK